MSENAPAENQNNGARDVPGMGSLYVSAILANIVTGIIFVFVMSALFAGLIFSAAGGIGDVFESPWKLTVVALSFWVVLPASFVVYAAFLRILARSISRAELGWGLALIAALIAVVPYTLVFAGDPGIAGTLLSALLVSAFLRWRLSGAEDSSASQPAAD